MNKKVKIITSKENNIPNQMKIIREQSISREQSSIQNHVQTENIKFINTPQKRKKSKIISEEDIKEVKEIELKIVPSKFKEESVEISKSNYSPENHSEINSEVLKEIENNILKPNLNTQRRQSYLSSNYMGNDNKRMSLFQYRKSNESDSDNLD